MTLPHETTPRSLSAFQMKAIEVMRQCAGHDQGWAVVSSDSGSYSYDGQAWINWQTALSLVRRDIAEYDEALGLIRLWEHHA